METKGSQSDDLVTLCHMRNMEAELARVKLESEGIACFVRDANMAIADPLIVHEIPLLVRERDVFRAREILARPAEDDAEGEYVDDDWRCPRCHRKTVELMPQSRGRRRLWAVWILLFVMPLVLRIILWLSNSADVDDMIAQITTWGVLPWVLGVIVMFVVLLRLPRRKRCSHCGNEWIGRKSDEVQKTEP